MDSHALAYRSRTPGIGGIIKDSPRDFIVEEVTLDGTRLRNAKAARHAAGTGEYAHFVLEKTNWNTVQALQAIAAQLHTGHKRFSFAGTKDRRAVTTQLCSAWRIEPRELRAVRLKDVAIRGAWRAPGPVRMGDLSGNHFSITVRGVKPESAAAVKAINRELCGCAPNYFGEQRFGNGRVNTDAIGMSILREDLKRAVEEYLAVPGNEENEAARAARERFAREREYACALDYFPRHLGYERTLIAHLAERKNDFAGALRALPRAMSLLFVHAVQARLFNRLLSERIASGTARGGDMLPLVGYATGPLDDDAEALLAAAGLSRASFRVHSLPELSAKGASRPAFVKLDGFAFSQKGMVGTFQFDLPAGSYATAALREFIDGKK